MAQGIQGPPNQYGYGEEFDYSVWIPGTQVDLVNVPWNNDYRDVVKFNNRTELNNYINGLDPARLTFNQLSYVKPNTPVYLPITHSRAVKYNYIRVSNPLQPIPGDEVKFYYYFILDAEYVNPNNTKLVLQLDVWQTYVYDVTFGNCFVERGHISIANSRNFDNYGRDYLTIPEGDDLGSDYNTIMVRKRWVMTPSPWSQGPNSRYPGHDVLVVSTTNLLADPGSIATPNLESATGTAFQGTNHGAMIYVFDAQSFFAYMNMMKKYPWVTQGIISITMIPKVSRYHPGYNYTAPFPLPNPAPSLPPQQLAHNMQIEWRDNYDIYSYIPERYRHLKKFWTFPYMAIELTTFSGTPIVLRPERWNDDHATIQERVSLVPPAQRIEFFPVFYNSRINSYGNTERIWPYPVSQSNYLAGVSGDDYGEYIDLVTQIANFPTQIVVNDGAISYLASNTHGIAHQYRSTDWSQQRALSMAQGSYDVATGALGAQGKIFGAERAADIANTGNQNRTQVAQAAVGAVTGMAAGAGGGAVFGPVGAGAGAIGGAISGAGQMIGSGIQTASNDEALAIRHMQSMQVLGAQNTQGQLMRDTNKNLADYAARGDYANARDAIDAKVQDAALIQPTTAGQIGGETINIINGGLQVSARWKMIDQARIRQIGDKWLRYGYAVHASIIPPQTLKVMSKFTYWKMSETYIMAAAIPEGFKQAIRGILEKGVTVWSQPSYIGVTDWADNDVIAGITIGTNYEPAPPAVKVEMAARIMRMVHKVDSGTNVTTWALIGAGNFYYTTNSVKANAIARAWGDSFQIDDEAWNLQQTIADNVVNLDV